MKPTAFLINPFGVLGQLSRRCEGRAGRCSRPEGGKHAPCSGIHAKDAARYPRGLCRDTPRGTTHQVRADALLGLSDKREIGRAFVR